jgi:hypothetical protein
MKLVSVDVGLRNLAVCVLEGTSRSDLNILHWDVIDVLGEKNGVSRPLCFQCSKAAMWFQGERYACTRHCPKVRVPTKTSLSKKKVEDLRTQAGELGLTDLPTKKPELVNAVHQKLASIGWSKFAGGSAVKHQPVLDLARDLATSLGNRDAWWEDASLVVIENQKDRRMFAVQAMLTMFFVMKGLRVKGVSAVHKLNNVLTLDSTTTYRGRKKTGILHCEQLMPSNQRAFFRSHKKKDDLADSFLQGLWFLEH